MQTVKKVSANEPKVLKGHLWSVPFLSYKELSTESSFLERM
jgi:hypothetical protein